MYQIHYEDGTVSIGEEVVFISTLQRIVSVYEKNVNFRQDVLNEIEENETEENAKKLIKSTYFSKVWNDYTAYREKNDGDAEYSWRDSLNFALNDNKELREEVLAA